MEQHVKIVGILDIVFGVIGIIGGGVILIAFMIGAAGVGASGEEGAGAGAAALASAGLVGGIFLIAVSVFEIIVGMKLRAYKSWARIVQIIFGVMSLPGFPIGTALGVYYLWAMLNKDTTTLFEQRSELPRAA